MIATVCAVVMVLAIISAAFGFVGMRRAHVAKDEAQHSRSNAEKLLSFLIEDFYNELAPTGRLGTLGKLAQKTVAYYDGLPPDLVTPQTQINRAMALARLGSVQSDGGHQAAAAKSFADAKATFEKLRSAGDHSEPVTYGLALTLVNEDESALSTSTEPLDQAATLLGPLVTGAKPSRRVRQLYANDLIDLCGALSAQSPQNGIPDCDAAAKTLTDLGALDLSDLDAADSWLAANGEKAYFLVQLGRLSEAQQLATQDFAMTEKILDRRPDDLTALTYRAVDAGYLLAELANRQHDAAAAADYAQKAVQAAEERVRFDPSNLGAWVDWAGTLDQAATLELDRGEVARAIATLRAALALPKDPRSPKNLVLALAGFWQHLSVDLAMAGDRTGAEQATETYVRANRAYLVNLPSNSPLRRLAASNENSQQGEVNLYLGAAQPALRQATAAIRELEAVKVPATDASAISAQRNFLDIARRTAAGAAVQLGRYAQAEKIARARLDEPPTPNGATSDPRVGQSQARYILALAVAMQGREAEARTTLQPALAYYADQQKAGAQDTTFRHDYAYALYVSAISQPADVAGRKQRAAALKQASALIAGASAEARRLTYIRYVAGLIAQARTESKG